jgi:hypothetical protein
VGSDGEDGVRDASSGRMLIQKPKGIPAMASLILEVELIDVE